MSVKSEILVAGLAAVDMVFDVDRLPDRPEKYIAVDAEIVGGGGAANAAVALSRLNSRSVLLSKIGNDRFGTFIYEDLRSSAVDCSLLQITERGKSSFSSILVDRKGERQIVNFRGRGLSDQIPTIGHLRPDAVLADTRWLDATIAVLSLAAKLNIPGVLDAEAPVPHEAVSLASHVAFSAQGLRSYSGVYNIQDALVQVAEAVQGFVCVTDGENGVYSVVKGVMQHTPAYSITPVDTLGAGDVWHAAFACQLADRQKEQTAIRFANAAAALKCMRKGGGRASPGLSEVQEFIQERGVP